MYVLSRKVGEQIRIDEHTLITILHIGKREVKIGLDAPREVRIVREEARIRQEGGIHDRQQT